MPPPDKQSNSKSATGERRRYLNAIGNLTATEFLELWTACHDIGVADAAYLLGYPVWECGNEVYVFTGEGPDE